MNFDHTWKSKHSLGLGNGHTATEGAGVAAGGRAALIARLQAVYGISRDEVEREIGIWEAATDQNAPPEISTAYARHCGMPHGPQVAVINMVTRSVPVVPNARAAEHALLRQASAACVAERWAGRGLQHREALDVTRTPERAA